MDNNGAGLEKLTAHGSKEAMIQNMKDAGCSQETIECCMVVKKRSFWNGFLTTGKGFYIRCMKGKSRLAVWIIWFIRLTVAEARMKFEMEEIKQ